MPHQEHGGRVQAPAPEVPHRPRDHLAIAPAHLEAERKPALERMVGQHPLAEAVDRVHVRPVDVVHRGFEASRQGEVDAPSPALPRGEQLSGLGVDLLRVDHLGVDLLMVDPPGLVSRRER